MKKILIIHPEGNIANNPNLYGIVEILTEEGYCVDVKCFKRNYYQNLPFINTKLLYKNNIFEKKIFNRIIIRPNLFKFIKIIIKYFLEYSKDYGLVIGVDNYGIVEAELIARALKIPYGLISYEIYFEEETGISFKLIEKTACKRISFAVTQDTLRGHHLSTQNSFSKDLIINIPVAARDKFHHPRNNYLHEKYSIPLGKKIAIYAGSLDAWGMTYEILKGLRKWPSNWVMVLHSRYPFASKYLDEFNYLINVKLFISNEPGLAFNDLSKLISSANLGLGFYKNTSHTFLSGNNIKYLGLSSGKLSMYLQNNIPVITNNIGMMSEYIVKYKLGMVLDNVDELPDKLYDFDPQEYCGNCYNFFKNHLNLDITIDPFIRKVDELFLNN